LISHQQDKKSPGLSGAFFHGLKCDIN